jgi:hypothetical protein
MGTAISKFKTFSIAQTDAAPMSPKCLVIGNIRGIRIAIEITPAKNDNLVQPKAN